MFNCRIWWVRPILPRSRWAKSSKFMQSWRPEATFTSWIALLLYSVRRSLQDYLVIQNKNLFVYVFSLFTAKTVNRPNILVDIIKVLNDFKMDLISVNTAVVKENGIQYSLMKFNIMIRKRDDFDRLANNLKSMKDVIDIIR